MPPSQDYAPTESVAIVAVSVSGLVCIIGMSLCYCWIPLNTIAATTGFQVAQAGGARSVPAQIRADSAAAAASASDFNNYYSSVGLVDVDRAQRGIQAAGLPEKPSTWSVPQVSRWITHQSNLKSKKCLAKRVEEHSINGQILLALSPRDIENGLGVVIMGERIRFQAALEELRLIDKLKLPSHSSSQGVVLSPPQPPPPNALQPPAYA
ncbi:hypothetical protein BDR26DRAFT_939829 [Obelidium mucronatum]|nr:hypothetical protein BDR26DRAFT_939829 [Obelidium mucronatum]